MLSLLLVEDKAIFREAIRRNLSENFPSIVIDEAATGEEALRIQIAILAGYDLPEYRQAALQYGADCFLVKESLKADEIAEFVRSIKPDG